MLVDAEKAKEKLAKVCERTIPVIAENEYRTSLIKELRGAAIDDGVSEPIQPHVFAAYCSEAADCIESLSAQVEELTKQAVSLANQTGRALSRAEAAEAQVAELHQLHDVEYAGRQRTLKSWQEQLDRAEAAEAQVAESEKIICEHLKRAMAAEAQVAAMSDAHTRKREQWELLCAEQRQRAVAAEAQVAELKKHLKGIEFSSSGYCPACSGWEVERGRGCLRGVHTATCWLADASKEGK